jgi:hypothetical protein
MMASSSGDLLGFAMVIVSRDHGIFGWTLAFFKESMRRDAITGTRIVFALRHKLMSI